MNSMTNDLTGLVVLGMLLVTVSGSSLPMATTIRVSAQIAGANETVATPTANGSNNMTGLNFLFIQSAQSGSASETDATTSTLELSDVSDRTILFSDRPDRVVASINTTDFVGNWSTGPDSFAEDPPNAVLILDDVEQQRQDFAVIELFNPVYDSEASTLRYEITPENATTAPIDLPSEFGQSTLVIDDKVLGDAPAMEMGNLYQRYGNK